MNDLATAGSGRLSRRVLLAAGAGVVGVPAWTGCSARRPPGPSAEPGTSAQPGPSTQPGPSAQPDASPGAPDPPATPTGANELLAGRLARALEASDRGAFVGNVAEHLRTQAGVIFDNARQMSAFALYPADDPDGIRVRWRAAGERDAFTEAFTFRLGGDGLVEWWHPRRPTGTPEWWRHLVLVAGSAPAWVVAARRWEGELAGWLEPAVEAARLLRAEPFGRAGEDWDGTLVLGLPYDSLTFAAPSGGYVASGEGALGTRIMLNPENPAAPEDRLGLIAHEGVHVITLRALAKAPAWLREGLAEHVATRWWPRQAVENERLVRAAVAEGPPTVLPADADFRSAQGETAVRAYALAAVAARACEERWGREALLGWYDGAPARPTDHELTGAYLDALAGR